MASMSLSLGHSRLSPATLKTFPMHHLQFKNPQQSRLTLSPNTRRRRAASVKVISEAYTTVDAVEGVPLPVLTYEGESVGEEVIDLKKATEYTARAVVHRGVITQLQNRRRGTASTLTRGQVRGGGRKPYSQKGTGRARRGSQRSPLIVGGGVIFGPKPKDWTIKINKKERRLALSTALMSATVSTTVVEDDFLEKLQSRKTKDFISLLKRWGVLPSEHSLLFCTEVSDNVRLGCRNLKTVKLITPRNLNLYDVLRADKLLLTRSGVRYLNRMYGYDVEEGEEMLGEEEEEEEEEQAPQQEEEYQGQEEAPQ